MKTCLSIAIALLVFSFNSFSQNNFWKATNAKQIPSYKSDQELFGNSFKPAVYKLFSLDETAFSTMLKQSPKQTNVQASKSNFIVSIPVADGNIKKFRITESPVMMPKLQAKYPEIKTYLGKGVDDPSSNIRFDFSPYGFHAIIISSKRSTIYINPVPSVKGLYTAFDRSNNISQDDEVFNCEADKLLKGSVQGLSTTNTISDGNVRTYRFAVATGGEFSALLLNGAETTVAQKKASVMAALVTDLIRTNIIYEIDFGVHLNYVDNEDTLIFLDGATDPFSSTIAAYASGNWLKQSQKAIDSLIGTANYDIGHLLMGYNTGGIADVGVVCNSTSKASAVTGYKKYLTDDPFVVDYWDHEIGHEFGAYHTYDYKNDASTNGLEPGSASTIMGYAGVTGATDIQQHSDPYFHAGSIAEVETYITAGDGASCAVVTESGNSVPTIQAGKDYTIPKSTPFVLIAKGADDDAINVLTYCWEQYDPYQNGTSYKFPKDTSTTGPVFRSITPSTISSRTFPALNSILDGTNGNKWEVLPAVSRTLNFRVTVRDNVPGGGNTNSDDMKITVDGNSGPFKVKTPNGGGTVGSGSLQTVTWDVAGTNTTPVNCGLVNILLSADGGITFPYLLVANTPNDGSQAVPFPIFTGSITHARIKIEASANIFFDISDADFTIEGSLPLTWVSFSAEKQTTGSALLKWSVANEINNNYFEIERSTDAAHFATLGTLPAGKNFSAVQSYTYTDAHVPSGTTYYRIKQVDNDGKYSYTKIAKLNSDAVNISWSVAPNPAADHTTILFNAAATNVHVYLTNAEGKIVYRNILSSANSGNQLNIPVSQLAKGVYILRVETNNNIRTEKIIKN